MNLASILAFLAPFEVLLKPGLLQLEDAGAAELKQIIAGVSSPDLKALFMALEGALEEFTKLEIEKL